MGIDESGRKQELLDFLLKNKGGVNIGTLVTELKISRTAVQQHVSSLERDGYIRGDTFSKTAGRPVRLYVLTEKGVNQFPKQYAWFSELLLDDIKENLGSSGLEGYMHRLGVRTANSILTQLKDTSEAGKVDFLMTEMQKMGYEVSTQQSSGGGNINITACNCIYHNVAIKHNEICEFDRALISTALGKSVEQTDCMAKGENSCQFLLNGKKVS